MEPILLILDRTQATFDAATLIRPTWEWPEKLVTQMGSDLAALDARLRSVAAAEVEMRNARGLLDAELEAYRGQIRTYIRLGKLKYKKDPVKAGLLKPLSVRSNGRQATLETGRLVEQVWKKIDQTWAPLPELTFAACQACGATCLQYMNAYSAKLTEWQEETKQLQAFGESLDGANVQWYATATTRFPADTPLGRMIRSTIPTSASSVREVGPAVIDQATALESGQVRLEFHAERATLYRILRRPPDGGAWMVALDGLRARSATVEGLAAGEHQFQVVGRNSRGEGQPSAPVSVTVAEAEAA
jgi:hypothetical protein